MQQGKAMAPGKGAGAKGQRGTGRTLKPKGVPGNRSVKQRRHRIDNLDRGSKGAVNPYLCHL